MSEPVATLAVYKGWFQAWSNAQPTTDPWQVTVRIDGDLPPVRVGDRVRLTTGECSECGADDGEPSHVYSEKKCCPDCDHPPFATATVAHIDWGGHEGDWAHFVTVTDVEAL